MWGQPPPAVQRGPPASPKVSLSKALSFRVSRSECDGDSRNLLSSFGQTCDCRKLSSARTTEIPQAFNMLQPFRRGIILAAKRFCELIEICQYRPIRAIRPANFAEYCRESCSYS